jgi:uncharacterized damage-inducible protein DinB
MAIKEALLPEFDHEMSNTRKTLERVPDDKFGWKPHEKSGTMGWLAAHIANIPGWTVPTIGVDQLDVAPADGPRYEMPQPQSRQGILELFDKNVADARKSIAETNDEHLLKPWTLLATGKQMFTAPRIGAIRGFIMNHTIHHRAQLGVYLRLNDIPVPAIYGPSADEGGF